MGLIWVIGWGGGVRIWSGPRLSRGMEGKGGKEHKDKGRDKADHRRPSTRKDLERAGIGR